MVPASSAHPSQRGLFLPRNARPLRATSVQQFGMGPKFLLSSSAPASGGFWQRRSEPVKALRCASTADAAPTAAWTEPSAPLPRRKSHEAGALNKRNLGFRQCSPSCTQIAPQRAAGHAGIQQWHNHHEQYSRNGTASNAAPHRKNAARQNRSESPYQQRTSQKDNPTQQLIKQAVDYLIQQLEAGKSETLTAYLGAMARFHSYSLREHFADRQTAPDSHAE